MTTDELDAAIIDLDGTVYRGDRLLQGADHGISALREAGLEILFLSNKAIERREDYSEKLSAMGVTATREDVINSGWVTAQYVAEQHPDRDVLVIGERPLVEELRRAGVRSTEDTPGDVLVVSMDREFTYDKLHLALRTLDGDAAFLATNPDRTCPTENGSIPDAGGMIGAVEGVTGREPDRVLGKPSNTMVETALGKLEVGPETCLMIGDRLETDIVMGERAGMTTVLVLTGVTDEADLAGASVEPDHVIDSLADVEEVLEP